jgi:hypothetical protein
VLTRLTRYILFLCNGVAMPFGGLSLLKCHLSALKVSFSMARFYVSVDSLFISERNQIKREKASLNNFCRVIVQNCHIALKYLLRPRVGILKLLTILILVGVTKH